MRYLVPTICIEGIFSIFLAHCASFGHLNDHSSSKDLVTASTMIVTAEAYCDSPKSHSRTLMTIITDSSVEGAL